MESKKIEVLAPVGNGEMLVAAVRCGADAVYLGTEQFNARRNAENFTEEKLAEAIKYCHIRGVKVYLTLNILLGDSELAAAIKTAELAHKNGIDGIIAADLGLIDTLHRRYPDLPLHASTQMTVHSISALPSLKRLGVKRVVVSRETSKENLKLFCAAAKKENIEVEVFVQGALCMCVSGQCLLSSVLGERSGNRGLCAGPCRLPFSVKNGTGYDLSLKDLSLLPYINELVEMGVASLKIEGRMKRPEYVAAAVNAVKRAVETGRYNKADEQLLEKVFSRDGFTSGYYQNKKGKAMFGTRTKENVLAADSAYPTIHEMYRNERAAIPLDIKITLKQNEPIRLTLCDGTATVVQTGEPPQAAIKSGVTEESVIASVTRLGGTPYFAQSTTAEVEGGLFVPASLLNTLRRSAIEQLDKKRSEVKEIRASCDALPAVPLTPTAKTPKIFCRFDCASQIPDSIDCDMIILPIESEWEDIKTDLPLAVDIPRWIENESAIKSKLALLKQKGVTNAFCGNLAAINIAKESGFTAFGDFGLNVFNSSAAEFLSQNGVSALTLSPELTISAAARIGSSAQKGIIAYGRLPLMLTVNCPIKNGTDCKACGRNGEITDRLGIKFPVRCRNGTAEILNSKPIILSDKQNDLAPFDFITLYFTTETAAEVQAIITLYKNGAKPNTDLTRGLYYRGTI